RFAGRRGPGGRRAANRCRLGSGAASTAAVPGRQPAGEIKGGSAVDFLLDEEQRHIVAMVRQLAREKVAPYAAQWDAEERFPTELVEAFGELGLLGLPVPEEYGGLGASLLTRCLVVEELAKVDASAALLVAVQDLGLTPIEIGR